MTERARSFAVGAALVALAACGGVHHTVREEVPQPATVAVLPFGGPADVATREAARALVQSRLALRGYRLAEIPWVDRVMSERGWLRDPARFSIAELPVDDVIAALGVDALAIGKDFDETSFNVFVLRRHSFGGTLALQTKKGVWWSANHDAGAYGGLLLTSGQLVTEVRAQGNHRTPMSTLALIDEFVADVAETVPLRKNVEDMGAPPAIADVTTTRRPVAEGGERIVVEGRATPGCTLSLDLLPAARGVPMVALPGTPDRYRGTHDLPANTPIDAVVVRARTSFGLQARSEVKP